MTINTIVLEVAMEELGIENLSINALVTCITQYELWGYVESDIEEVLEEEIGMLGIEEELEDIIKQLLEYDLFN